LDTESFLLDAFSYDKAHITGGQLSLSDLSEFNLEKEEMLVYSCLDFYPKDIDVLQRETKITLLSLFSALSTLVSKGLIKESYKNYYERVG
ncbi:MAG: hypothetical protein J6N76_10820, partial [Lachnospiraceae bacterium]|nr:hypothetical protein [Lachnospiraceae bacterium]